MPQAARNGSATVPGSWVRPEALAALRPLRAQREEASLSTARVSQPERIYDASILRLYRCRETKRGSSSRHDPESSTAWIFPNDGNQALR